MENYNNENVEYYEAEIVEMDCDNSESGHGGLIALGIAGVVAAGAGIAAFAAKKTGKLDEFKESRREKKIAKLEAKLEKEYIKIEGVKSEEDSEEEE